MNKEMENQKAKTCHEVCQTGYRLFDKVEILEMPDGKGNVSFISS